MARDGSGTYSRPVAPYVYDAVISETDMNSEMDQIATALTYSIAKDGQTAPTANLPMGGYRHTSVAAAAAQTDYLRVDQAQKSTLTYLTSVGGTADAITATAALGMTALTAGMRFHFIPGSTSTNATVTINVNAIGAITFKRGGTTALEVGDIVEDRPAEFIYDGTYAQLVNPIKVTSTSGLGAAAYLGVSADIKSNGTNLIATQPVITKNDIDYTILTTDRNNVVQSVSTTTTRVKTLPSAAAAGSNWSVTVINVPQSAFPTTVAASSGNIYGAGYNNAASVSFNPGEGGQFNSNGSAFYITNLTRNFVGGVRGVYRNLKISTPDAGTTATVTADQVIVEDTNGLQRRISSLSVAVSFATTGAGKLDTGSIATGTRYAIWAIAKPDGTASCIGSASFSSPTMPTGYTYKARIGSVVTKSGAATFVGTLQYGDEVQITANPPPNLDSGTKGSTTAPTWVAASVSAYVPTTASRVRGHLSVPTSGSSGICAPNNSYSGYNAASNRPPVSISVTGLASGAGSTPFDFILESTDVYWAAGGATSELVLTGWKDNLI